MSIEADKTWGYSVIRDVPELGESTFFRIDQGGLTQPAYMTKPDHRFKLMFYVLSGQGETIKTLPSGGYSENTKLEPGSKVSIETGQAYAHHNTGQNDLLLVAFADTAFSPNDEIKLPPPLSADEQSRPSNTSDSFSVEDSDGNQKIIRLPSVFYERIAQALAAR